jgi:ABC-type molybdate transport system permease subunit
MNPKAMLTYAHCTMATTLCFSLLIVYVMYGTNFTFTIPVQALLHVCLIIFPTFFKISYIVRLNALKQLGKPVN